MRVCRTGGLVRTVDGGGQGTGAHGVTPAAVRRERQLAEQGAVAVVCARVTADVCQRGRSHPWPHVIAAEKRHRSAPGRPAEEQRRRVRAASRWRQQGVADGGMKSFSFLCGPAFLLAVSFVYFVFHCPAVYVYFTFCRSRCCPRRSLSPGKRVCDVTTAPAVGVHDDRTGTPQAKSRC